MECLLSECLDISTVMDSTSTYSEWLKQSTPIMVDASKVMRVDTAGIQALASMFKTAQGTDVDVKLLNATDTLQEGIAILGLGALFQLDQEQE